MPVGPPPLSAAVDVQPDSPRPVIDQAFAAAGMARVFVVGL